MAMRLWGGLVVFVLLIGSAATLVYLGDARQDGAVDGVVSYLRPLDVTNVEIRADFANAQSALRAFILTGEPRFLHIYQSVRANLGKTVTKAEKLARGSQAASVGNQRKAMRAWFGFAGQMLAAKPSSPELTRLTNAGFASARSFYLANGALHASLEASSTHAITSGQQAVDHAGTEAGTLAALAALLCAAAAVATIRNVTSPLRRLASILGRLAAGDHRARAVVAGPAEIQEVASSLNALADESDRLRDQEAERNRLRAMARETGLRIRESLVVEDLIREAQTVIEENLGADLAYLHVVQNGRVSPRAGHEHDWVMPPELLQTLPDMARAQLSVGPEHHGSLVVNDLSGPEGDRLPTEVREPLRTAGVVSQVLTPCGFGGELLGLIMTARVDPGNPWTVAEVDAVESIAADIGRGLHHARMYEAENRLVAELRAVDRAKSDFLATVSHELRTPLTSIAGYTEILREREAGPLTAAQEKMLGAVERNTTRLRHLIEDVLTLSKIESGAFKTSMQPVNLADVVAAAVTALQPLAAGKGVCVTSAESSRLTVGGDPGQLDRLVNNVLSNAVKFSPDDGQVEISVSSEGPMAVLTVRDTGIGIPEAEQKGLFTRFFRASNAVNESIPGTGLGLAIVRTIVANHGGEMVVRSREGQGTTVTIRIPLLAAGDPRILLPEVPVAGGGRPG